MSIGEPHAHMRESMESMFDFSSTSASARSSLCLFVNSRLIQMSCSSVYLPLCTPSSTAIRYAFVIPSGSRKTTASPWENVMDI
jgi:hypothetical protein